MLVEVSVGGDDGETVEAAGVAAAAHGDLNTHIKDPQPNAQ